MTPPAPSAEDTARSLSAWHVLDMVHIYRNHRMSMCGKPCGPVQRLVDADILKQSAVLNTKFSFMLQGPRFQSILNALHKIGRVHSLEREEA